MASQRRANTEILCARAAARQGQVLAVERGHPPPCQNCARTIGHLRYQSVVVGQDCDRDVCRWQYLVLDRDTWPRPWASIQLPVELVEWDGGARWRGAPGHRQSAAVTMDPVLPRMRRACPANFQSTSASLHTFFAIPVRADVRPTTPTFQLQWGNTLDREARPGVQCAARSVELSTPTPAGAGTPCRRPPANPRRPS